MSVYSEEDFYKDNGSPVEEYRYCAYGVPAYQASEFKSDYDLFALVVNALYPYIRLARIKGNIRLPCGLNTSPATDGSFARLTDDGRDAKCPKIVWGIAAVFVANLDYSDKQRDYVLCKCEKELYSGYYNRYWKYYESNHSGLKYSRIPIEQKEIDFISEHLTIEGALWEKSSPLKTYGDLYQYALNAKSDYEEFVLDRKKQLQEIMKPEINSFYTEIRSTFDTHYVKVFFLDDTVAQKVQERVQSLNCVRGVNMTNSYSSAHPGISLTVYPKPMVTAEYCEQEIKKELISFFSKVIEHPIEKKTEAHFEIIEQKILDALDSAQAMIDVCVAWFTNETLRDKLLEMQSKGVKVRVIIYDDGINARNGVDLTGVAHRLVRASRSGIMHKKYCVVDNAIVISGSYNWTSNAEHHNDEDITIEKNDIKLASSFTRDFNEMWGE